MGWFKNLNRDIRELKRTMKRRAYEARKTYYDKQQLKSAHKRLSKKSKRHSKSPTVRKRIRKSYREQLINPVLAPALPIPPKPNPSGGATPMLNMVITYNGNNIVNGQMLSKSTVAAVPKIIINDPTPIPNSQYLIVMTDPDAPMGTFTHMVAVYTNTNTNKGNIQYHVPYYEPTPPSGIHRYQFRLFNFTGKSMSSLPRFTDRVDYSNIILNYTRQLKQLGGIQQFTIKAS
jgi:hypothetical protein